MSDETGFVEALSDFKHLAEADSARYGTGCHCDNMTCRHEDYPSWAAVEPSWQGGAMLALGSACLQVGVQLQGQDVPLAYQ